MGEQSQAKLQASFPPAQVHQLRAALSSQSDVIGTAQRLAEDLEGRLRLAEDADGETPLALPSPTE